MIGMTPVETGERHGSADQGSALGGSQEGGGNASAQRREGGRPGCEAIGRARCWRCWRGRQVGGTSPQGGWQSRHGAFEVTSAPARRSHRSGATHRGVPPRLTDLPLRHLSPPPFKTSLASNKQTSPNTHSVQPDPSHTVDHGRYLLFEWPAARLQPRALSYAVRRGGPATFAAGPAP